MPGFDRIPVAMPGTHVEPAHIPDRHPSAPLAAGPDGAGLNISVVIVNWNTRELLDRCLLTLERDLAGHSSEIWVVDNASADGSPAFVRARHPAVRLIENTENVGFARANNQALRLARGRRILLLNSDTEIVPGALGLLIACLEGHDRAGIAAPRLVNRDGSFQAGPARFPTLWSTVLEAWGLMQLLIRNPYYPSARPAPGECARTADWAGGACLLVCREAMAEVGLLDEAFFMNSEEVDWCFRMRRAGWQVWYEPAAAIVHLGGASAARSSAAQRKRNYRGKVQFLSKHRGVLAGRVAEANLRASAAAKAAAYAARAVLTSNTAARQRAAALWRAAFEPW